MANDQEARVKLTDTKLKYASYNKKGTINKIK